MSATVEKLEALVEASSRRHARVAAGIRALGSGNILNEPLAELLAGDGEMRTLAENRSEPVRAVRIPWRATRAPASPSSPSRARSPTTPRSIDATRFCPREASRIESRVGIDRERGDERLTPPPLPSPPFLPLPTPQPDGLHADAVAVRHRVIDDVVLRECVPANGVKQVVVLNAGMGTRPYRLHLPDVVWFEVDQFEVLELKRLLLADAPAGLRRSAKKSVREIKLVGSELAAPGAFDRLNGDLLRAGLDPKKPALFVAENVFPTLDTADAAKLVRSFPKAPGSIVVASCFTRRTLEWTSVEANIAAYPLALAEECSRRRSHLEGMRRSRAFGGWRLCNLKGLSQHARAYGYVVTHGPGNECAMPERAGEEMVFELRRRRPWYVRPFVMLKNVVIRGGSRGSAYRPPRRGRPATGPAGPPACVDGKGARGAKGSRDYGERPVGWRRRWATRAAFLLGAFALGATRGEACLEMVRDAARTAEEKSREAVAYARDVAVEYGGKVGLELDKEKGGRGGGKNAKRGKR